MERERVSKLAERELETCGERVRDLWRECVSKPAERELETCKGRVRDLRRES